MVEVKNIPSTVHPPYPSYLTAQVRKFYEVTFLQILLGDFLLQWFFNFFTILPIWDILKNQITPT